MLFNLSVKRSFRYAKLLRCHFALALMLFQSLANKFNLLLLKRKGLLKYLLRILYLGTVERFGLEGNIISWSGNNWLHLLVKILD